MEDKEPKMKQKNLNVLQVYGTILLKGEGSEVLTFVSLRRSGVCKPEGTGDCTKPWALAGNVVSCGVPTCWN